MSLLEMYLSLHKIRTESPLVFGTHLGIQLIGHSLGRNSICPLKPRAVRHNTFVCILGDSGAAMKSTAQEEVLEPLTPVAYRGPRAFTPEGLLRILTSKPKLNCPMGEFSTWLRGICNGGHMSTFKEIANELFTCPKKYEKLLADKDRNYTINFPYLSLSTTCTEAEFYPNVKPDMVEGGFLPRWILVYCPQKRKTANCNLPDYVDEYEELICVIFDTMYQYFSRKPLKFNLSDDALDVYNDICNTFFDDDSYDGIKPFTVRMERYIVAYADILYVSDMIGKWFEKKGISKLSELSKVYKLNNKMLKNDLLMSLRALSNSHNSLDKEYIERAWELLKPCIDYSKKVADYVNEDFFISKILFQIHKLTIGDEIQWSKLMRSTTGAGMDKRKFKSVIDTLSEREEVREIIRVEGVGKATCNVRYIKRQR